MTTETAPPPPISPLRPRRWVRRLALGVALTVALVVTALALVLKSLDRPWVKTRVQRLARAQAGVEVDWTTTRVRLTSGLWVERLVVLTPAPLRAEAPELARIDGLDVRWTPGSLLGSGPKLTALAARSLVLTVVRAADGRDSISMIEPTEPAVATPVPPLSQRVGAELEGAPPIGKIDVERASLRVIVQAAAGAAREELSVDGIGLHAQLDLHAPGGPRLVAALGRAGAPLELAAARWRDGAAAGTARARLWAEVTATAKEAAARLDLQVPEVIDQTLSPAKAVQQALALEATARFDAAGKRTLVSLARVRAGDGAVVAKAEVELPDAGAALVRHAEGTIDLPRLLALVPAGLVPVTAARAQLQYRIDGLVAASPPQLLPGGRLNLDGAVDGVRVELGDEGSVSAGGGQMTATAAREGSGATVAHLKLPLQTWTLVLPGKWAEGDKLEATVDGRLQPDWTLAGDARVAFAGLRVETYAAAKKRAPAAPRPLPPPQQPAARLAVRAGQLAVHAAKQRLAETRLSARDGQVAVHAEELHVDKAAPLATRGLVEIKGSAAALDFADAATRVAATGLGLAARARLRGQPPYAVDAELPIAHLRLANAAGRPLADGAARVAVHASDVLPDAKVPLRTRGKLRAELRLGALTSTVAVDKEADAAAIKVSADATSLAALRLLVPHDAVEAAPWDSMTLALRSDGRIERLTSAQPTLRHHTELHLDHPAWRGRGRGLALAAAAITVVSDSNGTLLHHQGEASLRAWKLRVGRAAPGDSELTTKFTVDAAKDHPTAHLELRARGAAGPHSDLVATVGFDRARRALTFDLDLHASRLAPLAPLAGGGLAGFDLAGLDLAFRGKGALHGLVAAVDERAGIRLVPHPLVTLAAEGALDLDLAGLAWARGDREVTVSKVHWHGDLTRDGQRRLLHGVLDADAVHVGAGDQELELAGVRDVIDTAVTDLERGVGDLTHTLTVRALAQQLVPGYPVGQVEVVQRGRRDRDGVIHLAEVRVDNRVGGTRLQLEGGIDVGGERRSLSLRGGLTQDLARLWTVRDQMAGRGTVSLAMRVESGNLRLFHALAAVKIDKADVQLPRAKVAIEGLEGEIPLTADFVLEKGRPPRVLRQKSINAYSELRFADQHPLLRSRSFVALRRLTTPQVTLGPLAGNLRVEHNIVSLSQLELGLRGGRVTGQCLLEYKGDDSVLQLHVRASNVGAAQGEPFDGNSAVVLSMKDRTIEGRAEILRISKRHLTDLLDLVDPHRADGGVNRVRRALALGYPDKVRLGFNHGFANVRVTLGGLARFFRIDELRGIPVGPLIDKALAPLRHKKEERE